ncbi:MAG: macro domain-containing protein [Polyangiales bacterium]
MSTLTCGARWGAPMLLAVDDAPRVERRGDAMTVKVILVDVSPKVVAAWRDVFEDNPEVTVTQGSMLDQHVDAWVTSTNARGAMDSGLDSAIRNHLGAQVQTRVQQAIAMNFRGSLQVGQATCVDTGCAVPRFLISTPVFTAGAPQGGEALDVALACGAALQAVALQNRAAPGSITSVAIPGLGANTGRLPVEVCADLLWTAYNLLRHNDFVDFTEMRGGLLAELGDLGNDLSVTTPRPAPTAAPAPPVAPAPVRRPGVLGPVVPAGVMPRRGVAPAVHRPAPQVAPAPYRQAAPAAPAPRPLDDFDDSE